MRILLLNLYLLSYIFSVQNSNINEVQISYVGESIILHCNSDTQDVDWIISKFNKTSEYIYSNNVIYTDYINKCNILRFGKQFNLFINNTQKSDIGLYKCIEDSGASKEEYNLSLIHI